MRGPRVVIVGGGLIGLSAARALASRGVTSVLVLERGMLASGGTGKSSGIVRAHYGVPSLAALSWRSLPQIEKLGGDIGFRQVGYCVIVGPENEAALRANIAMHQGLGIEAGLIGVDDLAAKWPMMNVADVAAVGYEPRGGFADATQLALQFGQAARAQGAQVRQGTPVTRIRTAGDKVTGVETAAGDVIEADQVILAAGWWSARLLAGLGIHFPVDGYRSELVIIDAGVQLADLPVVSDLISLQYGRIDGTGQFLVGDSDHSHPQNKSTDPDNYSNAVSGATIERYAEKLVHRFPGFPSPAVTHGYAGVYDVPPDWNPVIAPLAAISGLTLAAGFAGHGFKISPAVGELIAGLVLDGGSPFPDVAASDFRLERFAEGKPLSSLHPYTGAGLMR